MNKTLQDRWQAHLRLAEEYKEQERKARLLPCHCVFVDRPEKINKTAA